MAIMRRERSVPDWPEAFGGGRFPWPHWFVDWEPLRGLWDEQHIRVEEFVEDGGLVIRAELPGVDPAKDISVTVDHGILRIHAERREEEKSEGRRFRRAELRYGAFTRELPLPPDAGEEAVKAEYRDGILTVRLPLGEEKKEEQKIPIAHD